MTFIVSSRQINNEIGVHIHLKALITVSQIKHAFPWVSQVEVWATFCFLYFQLKHDLGCGWWPLPATSLSTHSAWIFNWMLNWASSTFLFVIMHLLPSANSCWPLAELAPLWDSWGTEIGFADLTGSCSTEEFKVLKETKKGGMLRLLIQFLWLLLVVSHLGEALTCYSCGPHSDQVIPWHFQRAS